MDKTISVIIPVYNVARYLPECLNSVISQSYRNLEIILIDDGSTDNSGAICDEFAEKDSRIRVIHQKNGGAAAAKNAGLRAATGTYLSFVDSDDFLEPDVYSYMVCLLEEKQADAVQCTFRDVFRNRTEERFEDRDCGMMTGTEYLTCYTRDWTCALLWDKLYLRELFSGIFFEEGHKIDDEYFTYQGIMNAHKVWRDNRVIYNYRKRGSSVMASPESAARILLDRIDCLSKRRMHVSHRFPELRKPFDMHFLDSMIILSQNSGGSRESIGLIQKQLKDYFRERGHTIPDFRLWPALVRLYFADAEKILERKSPVKPETDGDVYFE